MIPSDFVQFTSRDLPPGFQEVSGPERIPFSSEARPASLQNRFVAAFYADGQLAYYAYLHTELNSDQSSITLEHGKPEGAATVGGISYTFRNGELHSVANGHEEGTGRTEQTTFAEWVRLMITQINRWGRSDPGK